MDPTVGLHHRAGLSRSGPCDIPALDRPDQLEQEVCHIQCGMTISGPGAPEVTGRQAKVLLTQTGSYRSREPPLSCHEILRSQNICCTKPLRGILTTIKATT